MSKGKSGGGEVIKVCRSCGRSYTREAWCQLRYVGRIQVPADEEGPADDLELRDCVCRSTISVDRARLKKGKS